jgi:hypothetical protein
VRPAQGRDDPHDRRRQLDRATRGAELMEGIVRIRES